jgi:translation initiation factor 2B subunit (eIF-2B alpha/beta/delta family)
LNRINSKELRGPTRVTQAVLRALSEAAKTSTSRTASEFVDVQVAHGEILIKTRPTAILLAGLGQKLDVPALLQIACKKADAYLVEIQHSVDHIGEIGARQIGDGDTILCARRVR